MLVMQTKSAYNGGGVSAELVLNVGGDCWLTSSSDAAAEAIQWTPTLITRQHENTANLPTD